MEAINNPITERQKESCAISTMRRMIEKYSEKTKIPFEDAFFKFTESYVYDALFDYETGIWMEGPDYLMDLYEEALSKNSASDVTDSKLSKESGCK
jgi:hypothetical protein